MDQNDENQGKSFLINKDSCQTSILPQAFLKKSGVTIFPWMTWQQWLFPQVTPISCNFLCKSFFNSKEKLYIFYFSKLFLPTLRKMVFCYQNCSDLLWEKNVLVIEKNFEIRGWRPRICKNFESTRTIYSSSERS